LHVGLYIDELTERKTLNWTEHGGRGNDKSIKHVTGLSNIGHDTEHRQILFRLVFSQGRIEN